MHQWKEDRYLLGKGISTLFDGWLLHRLYQLLYFLHGPFLPFSWSFSIWPSQPLQQLLLLWRVWFYFQHNFLHRSFQHPKKHEKISLFCYRIHCLLQSSLYQLLSYHQTQNLIQTWLFRWYNQYGLCEREQFFQHF